MKLHEYLYIAGILGSLATFLIITVFAAYGQPEIVALFFQMGLHIVCFIPCIFLLLLGLYCERKYKKAVALSIEKSKCFQCGSDLQKYECDKGKIDLECVKCGLINYENEGRGYIDKTVPYLVFRLGEGKFRVEENKEYFEAVRKLKEEEVQKEC